MTTDGLAALQIDMRPARPGEAMAGVPARLTPRLGVRLGVRLAQSVLLVLTLGGALALAAQIATWPDHPLADMTHFLWWTKLIRDGGVVAAYTGTYPQSYMIYPPGMAYAYVAASALAERLVPLAGVASDDWLRVCVKLIPVAAHIVLAGTLFTIVASAGGFWRGWLAATLYAWNPAALLNVAYWGQGDSLNVALMTIAAGALLAAPTSRPRWLGRALRPEPGEDRRMPPAVAAPGFQWREAKRRFSPAVRTHSASILLGGLAGALLAAAGLIKPQTWVFLPLLYWLALRRTGLLGGLAFGAGAAATAVVMIAPWLRSGQLDRMLTVFTNVTQVMPSVSANAHNLWWLKLPGAALAVFDTEPLGGAGAWVAPELLNHATVGRLGFGLFALLPALRATGPLSTRVVMACLAYTSVAYFMTITQVHENHMFAAIPFLAATALLDPAFLVPFALASVCAFLNMALNDFLIGASLTTWMTSWLPWKDGASLQVANAMLNAANFVLLTVLLLVRPATAWQSTRELRRRARLVLLSGTALAGGALGTLLALTHDTRVLQWQWSRMSARALAYGPVEAHLGRQTAPHILLERAALELANTLYTLGGIAVIAGTVAAAAGVWWLVVARIREGKRYHLLETMNTPGPPADDSGAPAAARSWNPDPLTPTSAPPR